MTQLTRLLGLPLPSAENPRLTIGHLQAASQSLAIADIVAAHEGVSCIVAPTASAADRVEHELAFFAPSLLTRRFPDYETLPYEPNSPPQDLLADRLAAMHDLASGAAVTLIVNAEAMLGRLPPKAFIELRSLKLRVGKALDRDETIRRFVETGYLRVDRVDEPGEFAVRGALLDVFPAGSRQPVRIDLFDDEIESLRIFDVETQLTTEETNEIKILPAREFPFDTESIRGFRRRFRETLAVEPGRSPIYRDISEAVLPAGIEYYLPLFFDETVSLFDYLGPEALILSLEGAEEAFESGWKLAHSRFEQLAADEERPPLRPELAFWSPEQLSESLNRHRGFVLTNHEIEHTDERHINAATAHPLYGGTGTAIDRFTRWIEAPQGLRTLLVASSAGRREVVLELLRGRGYDIVAVDSWEAFVAGDRQLAVAVGELEGGLSIPALNLRAITAEQIGMEKPRQRSRRRRAAKDPQAIIRDLTDLREGAPVVHEDYGIGRYRGLTALEVDGVPVEFLLLEYAGGDKLYVPVHSLHLISRFTGAAPEQAPLHRLGTDQWAKARRKAAQQARDVAAELLNLYAQREARVGTRLQLELPAYEQFAGAFPFEETDDQAAAIASVLHDLCTDKPMDRIICGDVGFGKTEVALRSAFVAAHSGFQVAVLVPTTLLAQQHFQTFSDRFADWPVQVHQLSRFRSAAKIRETLTGIAKGTVDIVIGTHRLLQRDIKFKKLGLVIVDEEHRFGVKDKERLKKLRSNVDIMTMTATPIPRTLNMTLGGLRDLSIIATAPEERLSVKTFIGQWNDAQVREAILREIRRGGQVYFVHNRVEDIEAAAEKMRKLVPEAQVEFAHGQMSERELENVMVDFYHRRFNVLVCTTIVESGIDIPTANTIIIDRADKMGLAQLHQLRGRVGRSHHQAYAYLFAPPQRLLTADAQKRLEALESLDELGAGFTLATHDLEIRGAGELLGDEQSGQIQAVGFTLYNELLARAVTALREGAEPDLEDPFGHGPEVETGLVALIPEDYMPDVHMRLVHYKRIASAATREELDQLQVELIDRFGLLPEPTKALFSITWLKMLAQTLGIEKVQANETGGTLVFGSHSRIDPAALVSLVEDESQTYRLDGPYKLRFSWEEADESGRPDALETLLRRLGATPPQAQAA